MKKFLYAFLLFFMLLVVGVVIAANSSFVIKKAADVFAPDYNITYKDITGNIFTGVKIEGLAYSGMEISREIRFSWNPSKILYKRIAVSEIGVKQIDVDSLKALIASFPKSDDNQTSAPFPLVVTVGNVHISVKPFVEQNITVEKTILDAKDILYRADAVDVGKLVLQLDTGITDVKLHASLKEGELVVKELALDEVDSETLQAMFLSQESGEKPDSESGAKSQATLHPLVPKKVSVEKFSATLKPRHYKDVSIDKLLFTMKDLKADIPKVVRNKKNALEVKDVSLHFSSDVGQIDLNAGMKESVVDIRRVNLVKIDTMALKAMFIPEGNETNVSREQSTTVTKTEVGNGEKNDSSKKNNLIPQKVRLGSLHADILPATFDPVHILSFTLDAKDVDFDVDERLVEKGRIDLNATTNLSNILQSSVIRNNHLDGHIVLTPNKPLFERYAPTIRKEAIGDIELDFNASKKKVTVNLNAKAKHILLVKADINGTDANGSGTRADKPFNIDIDHLKAKAVYHVKSGRVSADADIAITTPIAKDIAVTADFEMAEKKIRYRAEVKAGSIAMPDGKKIAPLNDLYITLEGDKNQLQTEILSKELKGYFHAPDLKKRGLFHLETRDAIAVAGMVALPAELNATKVNAVIDVPLNLQQPVPLKGKVKITSNVADIDADIVYGDMTAVKLTATVPDDSLLRDIDTHVQWKAISPLKAEVKMLQKSIEASLHSKKITADMQMKPFEGSVEGKIRLAGLLTTLTGRKDGEIVVKSNVGSFKTLLGTINQFYVIKDLPKVDGKLDLSLTVNRNSDAFLKIVSPQIIYHADRKTDHLIDNVSIVLSKKGDNLELRSYQLTYNKMTIFATKPSFVSFKENKVDIPEFWLNDQLKISGGIDLKQMKGEITANAPQFHFSHEMIDLDSKIDIKAVLDGNSTDVTGKVTILGGDIYYDMGTKTFPSDSDIVIVQEMKKKESSPFMDHLTLLVNVDTQKPLVYRQGPVDIKAKVELGIHKAVYSDPMIIGSIDLVDGGSYTFEGKRFVLERSHVYLTGDPSKPMLDLTVKYKSLRHLITISVTGTPAVPNVLFSSVPSLTKEQILSIILFDSEEAAGKNNANDMMKMMGGAMAKSALNNLGVQIDHLVLGEGNSVEVGKKLTDDITVIYINGEIPKMELKYEYSPHIEVVIGASEQSESLDVVYRKDFNMKKDDDIVIKGREKK